MGKNVIIRLISVFALFMLMSSCGGNGEESGGYGAITFSVDWMDAPTLDLSHGASRAAIDCSASGVATVTATVYDSGNNAIATGGPWACAAHSGAITNVPAGSSRKLVIVGNDSEGKVKYRGELSGITVEDGKSIDAGSVATVNFVPALSAPANGATVNNGAFSFTWAGIGSASSYRIQISTNSGFLPTAIDTTVSTNSYAPSSQLSGTYYWRVRAIDAMARDGAWSVAYSCAVSSAQGTAPTAPTGVTATAGEGQVSISWQTVTGATSYNLYWATTSGVSKTNGTKIASVTSPYAHTGLTNGTKYYYVVTAVNGYGESAISSEVSGTPAKAILTGPIVNPTNGHSYYLLSQNTWSDSEAKAVSLGGHLATINDSVENDWINSNFSLFGGQSLQLWLGLNNIYNGSTFAWSSGDNSAYRRWDSGEPNNSGGNEHCVHMYDTGKWNDCKCSVDTFHGIVEVNSPTVSSTTPASNATGVAVNSAISATFSEAMQASSLTTSTFTVAGVNGTVSVNGTTATFTPSANLAYSTAYTATVTTGVKDAAGNALAANYSWTFTTGVAPETTPPTVSSTTPADNATDVAVSSAVSATFSEAMNASSITTASFSVVGISGTVALNGTTATFTPTSKLSYGTSYTAIITTGVKDSAGNALASTYSWTFTTEAAPVNYFADDFENGLGKWEVSGQDWAVISSDFRSGGHSITDSPNGNYPNDASELITMARSIDLSSAISPQLTFWHKYFLACLWNRDNVNVDISNDGGITWTNIASWQCNSSAWNKSIVDLSAYKSKPVMIRFRLSSSYGDESSGWYIDDVVIQEKNVSTQLAFPFSDDFENGLSNWEVSGQDWAVISSDFRSGGHSITDSPNGNYPNDANELITMAHPIELSNAISPQLTFWHKYFLACLWNRDNVNVDISNDGGITWTNIASWQCTSSAWNKSIVDLSAYKSKPVMIRFRLSSSYGDESSGWYIDDVSIFDSAAP